MTIDFDKEVFYRNGESQEVQFIDNEFGDKVSVRFTKFPGLITKITGNRKSLGTIIVDRPYGITGSKAP